MAYGEAIAALAAPTRRTVCDRPRRGPQPVVELARGLHVSRPAFSQHLRVLKEAGLAHDRTEGTRHYYSVDGDALAELREYFDGFWEDALAAFKEAAEKGEQDEPADQ